MSDTKESPSERALNGIRDMALDALTSSSPTRFADAARFCQLAQELLRSTVRRARDADAVAEGGIAIGGGQLLVAGNANYPPDPGEMPVYAFQGQVRDQWQRDLMLAMRPILASYAASLESTANVARARELEHLTATLGEIDRANPVNVAARSTIEARIKMLLNSIGERLDELKAVEPAEPLPQPVPVLPSEVP